MTDRLVMKLVRPALAALSVSALLVGCQLLSGASDISFTGGAGGGTGGGPGAGGGAGAQAGAGGQGGEPECILPEDCPPVADDRCAARQCVNATCQPLATDKDEPCGDGGICDGLGACVACTDTHDDACAADESCTDGVCAKLHCFDDMVNGGETDLNCGGLECPPCALGLLCGGPSDCLTTVCTEGTCSECTDHTDCDAGTWCNGGSCVAKKGQGDSCNDAAQCTDGFCADGVCCDRACNGTCEACITAWTDAAQGTCDFVKKRTDPQNECTAGACCEGSCVLLNLCL